jgi:hypothetical protein
LRAYCGDIPVTSDHAVQIEGFAASASRQERAATCRLREEPALLRQTFGELSATRVGLSGEDGRIAELARLHEVQQCLRREQTR